MFAPEIPQLYNYFNFRILCTYMRTIAIHRRYGHILCLQPSFQLYTYKPKYFPTRMTTKFNRLRLVISFFFSKAGIKPSLFFNAANYYYQSMYVRLWKLFCHYNFLRVYSLVFSTSTKVVLRLYSLAKTTIWSKSSLLLFGYFLRRYLFFFQFSSTSFRFANLTTFFDITLRVLFYPLNEVFFHISRKMFVGDFLLQPQSSALSHIKLPAIVNRRTKLFSFIFVIYNFLLNYYQNAYQFFFYKFKTQSTLLEQNFLQYWFFFFKHTYLYACCNFLASTSRASARSGLRTFSLAADTTFCLQFTSKLVFFYRKKKYIKRRLYKKLIRKTKYRVWPFSN